MICKNPTASRSNNVTVLSGRYINTSLPPELWLRIADFLPDAVLTKAASVSRTFLDAATERIFHHLVLDNDKYTAINATLDCIEFSSDIARRIRSLSIHTRPLRSACLQAERNTTTLQLLTRILYLLAMMPSLNALSIIAPVALGSHSEHTFVLKLLPRLFNAIPTTVAAITLTTPITTLLAHLAEHGRPVVPLSRLKKLSLRLALPPAGNIAAAQPLSFTVLGSFITSCNSLTHLELDFPASTFNTENRFNCIQRDFSALFVLSRLPLSHLSLRMPLGAAHYNSTPQALRHFLEMHTPNLQSLIVEDQCLCSVTSRPANLRLHTLSFPALRSLTLALNTKGLGDLRIPPFLVQVAETVAEGIRLRESSGTPSSSGLELCIEGCIRDVGELSSLVAPFCAVHSEVTANTNISAPHPNLVEQQTYIESLVIEVQHLSVTLFQLLSSLLPGPGLRALQVCYHSIAQGQDNGLIDSWERDLQNATYFASAMRAVTLPWISLDSHGLVLRDIRLKGDGVSYLDASKACQTCWTALVQCLPPKR